MAFVVANKRGRFEIRESEGTPKGPRSRTLAGFSELTDEVVEKARRKAAKPFAAEELRRSAKRAGAPVARSPIEDAARRLIAELARGGWLNPTLHRMLLDLLQRGYREGHEASVREEAELGVAEWMAATPQERGRALFDLLLLADALPSGGRVGKPLRFPRLASGGG